MHVSNLGLSGPVGSVLTVGGPTGALDLSVITGTGGIVISVGQGFINVDGSSIAGGGSGSVTSTSIVSANGFAGTVANPTTTPAITITATATGILKGTGTAIAAATAGTDYQAPITLTTTGSGGAATLSGNTLNIPQYSGGGSGTVNSGTAGQIAVFPGNGAAVSGTSTPVIPTVVSTFGPTTNFDLSQSNNQQVTLTGNPTLTLTNVTVGQRFTINLIQDGTGSRTVTWFSGITWAGGSAPTLQAAPGAIDTIAFWCNSSGLYMGYPTSLPVPGTSGQIPHNNGTTLVGSANAVIDSNSSFNLGSTVSDPGTPVAGALWPSSASLGAKFAVAPALIQAYGGRIYKCGACTAYGNASGTYTSLLQSPAFSEGSLTIPANTLKAGDIIRIRMSGTVSALASTGLATRLLLGTNPVAVNLSAGSWSTTAASNSQWSFVELLVQIISVGSSGTAIGFGYWFANLSNSGSFTLQYTTVSGGTYTPQTINTTGSLLIDFQWNWTSASASNSIQVASCQVFLDK